MEASGPARAMWSRGRRGLGRARGVRRRARRGDDERLLELARLEPGRPGARAGVRARAAPGSPPPAASGRTGEVVISDVAPEMTAIARRARRGARPRATSAPAVLDLEQIDEPDGSFDVVLCREGLMLVADPAARRARSGASCGPAAASRSPSGGRASANPWLGVVFDAVSAQLGAPMPPPGHPRPLLARATPTGSPACSRGGPGRRRGRRAADALPRGVGRGMVGADGGARRAARSRGSPTLPEPAAQALLARARRRRRPYETPDGLVIPGLALRRRAPSAR